MRGYIRETYNTYDIEYRCCKCGCTAKDFYKGLLYCSYHFKEELLKQGKDESNYKQIR